MKREGYVAVCISELDSSGESGSRRSIRWNGKKKWVNFYKTSIRPQDIYGHRTPEAPYPVRFAKLS